VGSCRGEQEDKDMLALKRYVNSFKVESFAVANISR
jgi:hypothetical protein